MYIPDITVKFGQSINLIIFGGLKNPVLKNIG